jgi:hypothetical protein
MSEAWREVARIGKSGEAYPHVLADSHGWCLRLGPGRSPDEKYYSSLPSLLQGLTEQILRRRLGADDEIRTLLKLRNEVGHHLRHVALLGAELERRLGGPARQRPKEASNRGSRIQEPGEGSPAPGIAAGAGENASEAA